MLSHGPNGDDYRSQELKAERSARVELLDHPKLVTQLCALERRTARGGKDSIDHAPNAHDDLANAVAGVVHRTLARTDGPTFIDIGLGPSAFIDGRQVACPLSG